MPRIPAPARKATQEATADNVSERWLCHLLPMFSERIKGGFKTRLKLNFSLVFYRFFFSIIRCIKGYFCSTNLCTCSKVAPRSLSWTEQSFKMRHEGNRVSVICPRPDVTSENPHTCLQYKAHSTPCVCVSVMQVS